MYIDDIYYVSKYTYLCMSTKPSQDQVLVLKRLPQFECNMEINVW